MRAFRSCRRLVARLARFRFQESTLRRPYVRRLQRRAQVNAAFVSVGRRSSHVARSTICGGRSISVAHPRGSLCQLRVLGFFAMRCPMSSSLHCTFLFSNDKGATSVGSVPAASLCTISCSRPLSPDLICPTGTEIGEPCVMSLEPCPASGM